jgi:hypothetical protein
MSHWDRRQALDLADAIEHKIKLSDTARATACALKPIAVDSAKASLTITTPCTTVDALRSQLCAVCRDQNLYHCDKPQGWSLQCTFLHTNK